MRVRTDDGVEIAAQVHGEGPRTVILHPGGGFSGRTWHDVLDVVDLDGVRLVVVDPRGTGESDRPRDGYSTERLARDVVAVADAVGADRFALLGHSMGGKICQYVACTWPNRVVGQMLITPSPAFPMPAPPEFRALMAQLPGNWAAFEQLFAVSSVLPLPSDVEARVREDYLHTDATAYGQMMDRVVLEDDFADKLGHTQAATLFVATDDPATPVEFVKMCAGAIPIAMTTYLPGAGHWAHHVMPRQVAAVFRAFVAGLSFGER